MPYSFPQIQPPAPVYLEPGQFFKNALLMMEMKQDREDRKMKNALLQAEIRGKQKVKAFNPKTGIARDMMPEEFTTEMASDPNWRLGEPLPSEKPSPYGEEAKSFEQFKSTLKPEKPSPYGPEAMAFEQFKSGLESKYKDTPEGRLAKQKELEQFKSTLKTDTEKAAQSYLLPDKTMVLSYDGGRTYTGEDGKSRKMPFNASKVGVTVTGEDLSMFQAQEQAAKDIGKVTPETKTKTAERIGSGGTGPYSTAAAMFDAVLGGAGIDKVFGANGFFKDTQENRQILRTIKQTGKAALMNSSRGAIWEQQRIDELFPDPDKIFTNPRTEAKKFKVLRDTLLKEKQFNDKAIVAGVDPKEVSALRRSNIEIERLLGLIGGDEQSSILTKDEDDLVNKYLK